jgi:hypothetical protein
MLPDILDRPLFDRLAAASGETLISVYLPTHVKGAEIKQDRIRFKNGLAEIDAGLEEAGWSPKDRAKRLEPARVLQDDEEFWQHQGVGLGVLINDNAETTSVALEADGVERTTISDVFHLRPMVPSLRTVELPVLVLTKGAVRLYRASHQQMTATEADLPGSFEDVNWFVDRERQRQRHPDRTGTNRARHGHEGGYRDEDLERFLRAVSEALPRPNGPEPLIVLGDDNLTARFGKLASGETLSPAHGGIDNVDDMSEIQAKAAKVLAAHESSMLQEIVDGAKEQLGTGTAITELAEALEAAVAGRIAALLIAARAEPVWGRFDPDTLEVARHEDWEPFADDLLDRLAVHAISTGSEVLATDGPIDGHTLVATTRF